MTAYIQRVSGADLDELISPDIMSNLNSDGLEIMQRSLRNSDCVWIGTEDGKVLGMWGLIAPTLLSDRAYLWLYTTEHLKTYTFIFVRHSQRAVQDMLKIYPNIVGHCAVSAEKSQRWLQWLGAKFGQPDGKFIPFEIEAH